MLQRGRFKKRGKKWYDWSEQESTAKWNEYMRDPQVPKGKDQFLTSNDFDMLSTS